MKGLAPLDQEANKKMEKETSHGIKDLNKKELEERKKFQELETVSEVWVVAFNILEEKQF